MTKAEKIENDYFDWMYDIMCNGCISKDVSYRRLFVKLYSTEFTYIISKDENRAEDGIGLRYRFAKDAAACSPTAVDRYLGEPCRVLEMMIALAIRCEESIMDDPNMGDRTQQWFWGMINNLGLGAMSDDQYDRVFVDDVLKRFLNRDYEADGRGGLFRVRNCNRDLRNVEIWYQLCWYLDTIG